MRDWEDIVGLWFMGLMAAFVTILMAVVLLALFGIIRGA